MQSSDPRRTLTIYRNTAVGLFVVAGLVAFLGWPRLIDCDTAGPSCDGSSGAEAFPWIGLGIAMLGVLVLIVHLSAVGTRLALQADRLERAERAEHTQLSELSEPAEPADRR